MTASESVRGASRRRRRPPEPPGLPLHAGAAIGTAGNVTGDASHRLYSAPCLGRFHTVTLDGLTPGTPYVFRVRPADDFRNEVVSPTGSFTSRPWPRDRGDTALQRASSPGDVR